MIVADVIMPGMDGRELARRVRALSPATAILLVSGYAGENRELPTLPGGRLDFMPKPYSPVDLTLRVRELIDA